MSLHGSRVTPPAASTNSCPGTGGTPTRPPPSPPDAAPPLRPSPDGYQEVRMFGRFMRRLYAAKLMAEIKAQCEDQSFVIRLFSTDWIARAVSRRAESVEDSP
ncbi:protein of unknown function [Magnetospirillum gryphiswaldense MSR-1 v2]|uniref:Uncharacterized protein n=1 Tax=Magnetospirillum gryphiswaldense (strain DSM 6361 / JCM 21280 / NBRC 15271 / MSR-1) TaxID=431944 RepID=V6EW80_MAGGM|nr:protein of unknown function [Magnetospirillum gryphiswaldense MSR-1 v2]